MEIVFWILAALGMLGYLLVGYFVYVVVSESYVEGWRGKLLGVGVALIWPLYLVFIFVILTRDM